MGNRYGFGFSECKRKTGNPLSFVNIGILNTTKGNLSKKDGTFTLKIENISNSDTIRFSYIGYETLKKSVKEVKAESNIILSPNKIELDEITVEAKRYDKIIRIGNDYRRRGGTAFLGWSEGEELGGIIEINKPVQVLTANFKIESISGDSLHFRLNIYDYKDGKIGDNLLNKNIYIHEKQKVGILTKNISDLSLILKNDVLLALEYIYIDGNEAGKPDSTFLFRFRKNRSNGILYRDQEKSNNIQNEFRKINNTVLQFYLETIINNSESQTVALILCYKLKL